ncbi:MAG: DUF4411 family protein [Prosthecobacter sp.]|uniref:DUF4411 family protein n=1 Tax=Prosthecobacter sp. TaxID=1965333 RepID=UPI0038FF97D9
MKQGTVYVLDANVLVQAHRRWYAFSFHPGFWDLLLIMHAQGRVVSIDRVRKEILAGDELEQWVAAKTPKTLFESTETPEVVGNFASMMQWVQEHQQFKTEAKAEFASVADGWLPAYALAHPNHVVVTHEELSPDAKKRVPLPNVCKQFGVPWIDTFAMLRELKARFVMEKQKDGEDWL